MPTNTPKSPLNSRGLRRYRAHVCVCDEYQPFFNIVLFCAMFSTISFTPLHLPSPSAFLFLQKKFKEAGRVREETSFELTDLRAGKPYDVRLVPHRKGKRGNATSATTYARCSARKNGDGERAEGGSQGEEME